MPAIILAKTSDISSGTMKSVAAEDKEILLTTVGGTFHAIASACPHMGAVLSGGKLEGFIVICSVHARVLT